MGYRGAGKREKGDERGRPITYRSSGIVPSANDLPRDPGTTPGASPKEEGPMARQPGFQTGEPLLDRWERLRSRATTAPKREGVWDERPLGS
jgi:hypothetical protein